MHIIRNVKQTLQTFEWKLKWINKTEIRPICKSINMRTKITEYIVINHINSPKYLTEFVSAS